MYDASEWPHDMMDSMDSTQIINHINDCCFKGLSEFEDFNTKVNMKVFNKLISLLIRTLKELK